jgi:hypothetical protein
MDKMDETIKFRLAGIESLQFAVFPEAAQSGEIGGGRFELDYELTPAEQIVSVIPKLTFIAGTDPIAVLEFAVDFYVQKENWPTLQQGDLYVLPLYFVRHLATIAIGIGRGIFHEKLHREGTFRELIWPLMDLTAALTEEVVIAPETE